MLPVLPPVLRKHLISIPDGQVTFEQWRDAIVPSPYLGNDTAFYFTLADGVTTNRTILCGGRGEIQPNAAKLQITDHLDFFTLNTTRMISLSVSAIHPVGFESETPGLLIAVPPRHEGDGINHSGSIMLDVPEVSQMPYEETPLTYRKLCMPACMYMVCKFYGVDVTFDDLHTKCHNKATNTYGIWPHGIASVFHVGLRGATIFIDNASDVYTILKSGMPIIASLRFQNYAIPDFPFKSTLGHMVVVRGLTPQTITVNDPAHRNAVRREYPLDLFMQVWNRSRQEIGHAIGIVLWKDAVIHANSNDI